MDDELDPVVVGDTALAVRKLVSQFWHDHFLVSNPETLGLTLNLSRSQVFYPATLVWMRLPSFKAVKSRFTMLLKTAVAVALRCCLVTATIH